MIFGVWNAEKIWHENLTGLSTSPVTLPWEIQTSHFQQYYLCILLTIYVISEENKLIHLPTPPENVTALTCEVQNYFIWLKVRCVLSNAGGSQKSQLWVDIGGSEKNRLWCVATGMSGKQCHSKCSEWSPSALLLVSSLFRQTFLRVFACKMAAEINRHRYRTELRHCHAVHCVRLLRRTSRIRRAKNSPTIYTSGSALTAPRSVQASALLCSFYITDNASRHFTLTTISRWNSFSWIPQ